MTSAYAANTTENSSALETPIRPQHEVYSLQQEIDALATSTQPPVNDFSDQSQYSYRNAVETPVESPAETLTEETKAPEAPSKFTFHTSQEINEPDAYNPTKMVSDNALDSFAKPEYQEPISSVQSISIGHEFVPHDKTDIEHSVNEQFKPTQPSASEPWGGLTEENKKKQDDDLYRLDDFSL